MDMLTQRLFEIHREHIERKHAKRLCMSLDAYREMKHLALQAQLHKVNPLAKLRR